MCKEETSATKGVQIGKGLLSQRVGKETQKRAKALSTCKKGTHATKGVQCEIKIHDEMSYHGVLKRRYFLSYSESAN